MNCEKCTFAVYNGEKQVDCKIDKLEKFPDKLLSENGYFDLGKRLCLYNRPSSWSEKYPDYQSKLAEELRFHYGIIIDADLINDTFWSAIKDFPYEATLFILNKKQTKIEPNTKFKWISRNIAEDDIHSETWHINNLLNSYPRIQFYYRIYDTSKINVKMILETKIKYIDDMKNYMLYLDNSENKMIHKKLHDYSLMNEIDLDELLAMTQKEDLHYKLW